MIPDELLIQPWAGVTLEDAGHDQLHAEERQALNTLRGQGLPIRLARHLPFDNAEHPGIEMPDWGGYYFLTNDLPGLTPPPSADPLVATFMFPAGTLIYEGYGLPGTVRAELEVYEEPAGGWGDGSDISNWGDGSRPFHAPASSDSLSNNLLAAQVPANSRLLVGLYIEGVTDPVVGDWPEGSYWAHFRFYPA